jgi:hypothetical protein
VTHSWNPDEGQLLASAAISLKRIADAMEPMRKTVTGTGGVVGLARTDWSKP